MNIFTTFWPGADRVTPQACFQHGHIPLPDAFATVAGNLPPSAQQPHRQASRQALPASRPSPHLALAVALRDARRPLTVTELAAAMGCCVGESSKRIKAARALVRTKRVGRCKLVSLRQLTLTQWLAVFGGERRPIGEAAP